MKVVVLTGLLLVFAATCTHAEEENQLEHIQDEAGNTLTLNITHKDAEDDIDVFDDKGESVIKVEIYEHDGYQIDKPANESVCLLSEIEEFGNKTFCYSRIDYPVENTTQELQDHCEGRHIYILVPKECEPGEGETAATEAQSGEDSGRVKRSWWCRWKSYYTPRCVRVRWCCRRRCYIYCSRWCTRYTYYWVKVRYFTCSYYW